jgi:hypothetical protein
MRVALRHAHARMMGHCACSGQRSLVMRWRCGKARSWVHACMSILAGLVHGIRGRTIWSRGANAFDCRSASALNQQRPASRNCSLNKTDFLVQNIRKYIRIAYENIYALTIRRSNGANKSSQFIITARFSISSLIAINYRMVAN